MQVHNFELLMRLFLLRSITVPGFMADFRHRPTIVWLFSHDLSECFARWTVSQGGVK